jgi:S1-C subfamily serine protease
MEEHGLEVVSVDPACAAARAGLRGKTPATVPGAAGGIGGLLLGPVKLLVMPLLQRSGALRMGGDLLMAVDDVRIHDLSEFRKAMRELKSGDSVYLTVMRPLPGKGHQTIRLMVRLDPCSSADVVAAPLWGRSQFLAHTRSLD